MTPIDTNAIIRDEWRALRFFYDRDDNTLVWRLSGSRDGLKHFATLLRSYASNPSNHDKSEHEHFGPYMYLKVMTWPEPGIGKDAIHGTLHDLARLAKIIDNRLSTMTEGDNMSVAREYVENPEYDFILNVFSDHIDPSSLDPGLKENRE